MKASEIQMDETFPHGTVDGFYGGCKTNACPGQMSCATVHLRYSGDYAFRKRIDAGLSADEIAALDLADAAAELEAVKSARLADREAAKAPRPPRAPRPARTTRIPADRSEEVRLRREACAAEKEATKAERAAQRDAARLERAALGTAVRAERAAAKKEEAEARAAEKRAQRAARAPKPLAHGTNAGYARGCRCDACHAAHKTYHREYSAMRRAKGVDAVYHGTAYGYQLGCKDRTACPVEISCCDASLAAENERRRVRGIDQREFVAAGPVRQHIIRLHRTMTYARIGELSGVAPRDIRRMVTGRDDGIRAGELAQKTDRAKAERIMAVTAWSA